MPQTEWYCISCVPISSFHSFNSEFSLTGFMVVMLAALMGIDCAYLLKLNSKLKQSANEANSANEAKTYFLSRMSHDIRTPINVISGMTELALMEKNPEKTTEYLKNIFSSGKFLLGLVNDILDMNKVESGNMELHPKPYSSSEFVTYVNAVIKPICDEKGVYFEMLGNADGEMAMLDPLRFNQIFFNLLSNAVKFTPKGGHVVLRGNFNKLSDNRIALDIAVSDDGIGMSEEFQKNMFKPFSQEERTAEQNSAGTGLGLAIVKSLVDLMQGTIRVESTINKGTTFFIHIETERVQLLPDVNNSEKVAGNLAGKRILLCEDHPLNAKIIVQMLSHRYVSVETAENGKIGVELFSASEENYYDAILMDVRMPVMNGLEAAKAIRGLPERKDAKSIPIIALTANAYDLDVENCFAAGMNAHLAKPVTMEKLCESLAQVIYNNMDMR